jgi:hypothetical protein
VRLVLQQRQLVQRHTQFHAGDVLGNEATTRRMHLKLPFFSFMRARIWFDIEITSSSARVVGGCHGVQVHRVDPQRGGSR